MSSPGLSRPSSPLAQKFWPVFSQIEVHYRASDEAAIEAYGARALTLKGPDRLYGLWSVLYVYLDHLAYGKLEAWIPKIQAVAAREHDLELTAFADFFQAQLDRAKSSGAAAVSQDWSRFLDRSGPDIHIMARLNQLNADIDGDRWADASETAQTAIAEAEHRGQRAAPLLAELYQTYGQALSDMGFTDGALDEMVQASMLDRQAKLPTQDLERIFDLSITTLQAGDLDLADYLARIHFRLARASKGPNAGFWTRYLCATVAIRRQEWRRVLSCTADLSAALAAPTTSRAAELLNDRAIARARLGQVDGARADLAILRALKGKVLLPSWATDDLLRIYIDHAAGRDAQAFEDLDRWRVDQQQTAELAHRRGVSAVISALQDELHRRQLQSVQLKRAVEISRRANLAWGVVSALFALLILGGLAWGADLRRVSGRLKAASLKAQAASAAKSTFLAVMSHELRTPLNGMLGMAQALRATGLTAIQNDLVETLKDSGAALLAILNDVLDLSKIEAGRIELEPRPNDIRAICDSVIAVYSFSAAERGNRIELQVQGASPPSLVFDPLRVRQCVANLLSNAIKFTHDGLIVLRLSVEPAGGDDPGGRRRCVKLQVVDSGIGMSPATLQKLFGAFVQADASTTRQYGGTGLGLNITLNLAKMMGGGVIVESQEGLGSTFTLTFLADVADADQGREAGAAHGPHLEGAILEGDASMFPSPDGVTGLKVLVVDDHPVNRKVAQLFLSQFGCDAVEAENGQIALERLEREAFDVILMDINMPVMDGLEATRRIRARPQWRCLPIIALTADAGPQDRSVSLAAGMNGHLAKPIDAADLFAALLDVRLGGQMDPAPASVRA